MAVTVRRCVAWLRPRHLVLPAALMLLLLINVWTVRRSPTSDRPRLAEADSGSIWTQDIGGAVSHKPGSADVQDVGGAASHDASHSPVAGRARSRRRLSRVVRKFNLVETAPSSDIWYASRMEDSQFSADELAALREVFEFVERPTARCANLTRLGGVQYKEGWDGDKLACLDPPLTLGQPGCLVYSMGINNEWSFDRAAAALGCEVHSFDPSMRRQPEGSFEPGITFHLTGIGRNNHTNDDGWRILVLDHLMAELGHRRRTIQYLKADAEGGEMDMLMDQLVDLKSMYRVFVLDRVEQLGLELHMRLLPEREATFYQEVRAVFRQLRRLGFDLVHSVPNQLVSERYVFPGVPRPVSLLYEVLLVRRRRAAPDFDANVHYPCGSKERCDLIDKLDRKARSPRQSQPPAA